jgi:hypothetical protein
MINARDSELPARNHHPQKTILSHTEKKLIFLDRKKKRTTKFHGSKSFGNNTHCSSDNEVAAARGGGGRGDTGFVRACCKTNSSHYCKNLRTSLEAWTT